MRLAPSIAALCLSTTLAFAQETYWIANRASNDIMQVTPWGSVVRRIAMGNALRSAHVAPDGKVWVVRFIQGTFDIVDPATSTITAVTSTLGSPFAIAFDNQGNGWVSGGSGVQQFAPNGALIQAFPLSTAAPLGITVDSSGNKWIAHRTTPPAVTRIDPSGSVLTFSLTGTTMLPTAIVADFRGLLQPSHLWVVGDSSSDLVELDALGSQLQTYPLPATNLGSLTFDNAGRIWVGSYGTGAVMQVDQATGSVLANYSFPPNVNGLATDSRGRIVATARITFSGAGPPCELRRIDPATGALEVPTALAIGGFSATGTQSAVSTPWQYALVVAPFGDMDGDGDINYNEVTGATSPIDRWSGSTFSVESTGVTQNGSVAAFTIQAPPTNFWLLAFSGALVAPGSGITLPGFGGELLLSPPAALPGTVSGLGPATLPLAIPALPIYIGYEFFTQGFVAGGPVVQFTNVSGIKVW